MIPTFSIFFVFSIFSSSAFSINTTFLQYSHDISLSKASMWKGKINNNSVGFSIYFLTKMLFSCLVDADYLDTEAFMRPSAVRSVYPENLSYLQDRLESYLQEKGFLCGKNGINFWRSEILKNCIKTGDGCDTGVYTLSVPTGGGKTVSSLAFALHHAVKSNKSRIIYVVPFCAIIDQTVDIFNTILGDENVLAHYSEADYEGSDEYEVKKLACENWDMPVIVTTAVQFYESLFSNKTGINGRISGVSVHKRLECFLVALFRSRITYFLVLHTLALADGLNESVSELLFCCVYCLKHFRSNVKFVY